MDDPSYKLPQLDWIRTFEAAARLGSFTAAASETGLTQPAVSHRIAQLEGHLGAKLFLRDARKITLTVAGEAWLPHVQTALSGLGESTEVLFARGRARLTISASQSVIALWLLPRLARMTRATGASLSFQTLVLGGTSAATDDVIQIRYGSGNWRHHYQVPLYPERLAPVAAPALTTETWSYLPRIACTGPRADWAEFTRRFSLPPATSDPVKFDTFHSAVLAAKAGHGVVLGSLPLCQGLIAAGDLVQLGGDILDSPRTYWLLATKSAIRRHQWDPLAEVLTS